MKRILSTAVAAFLVTNSVYAADPIYVVRPPSVPSNAAVLPQNAFTATPSTPTTPTGPSTPSTPAVDYVFKSKDWDMFHDDSTIIATASFTKGPYPYTFKSTSRWPRCQIEESEDNAQNALIQSFGGIGDNTMPVRVTKAGKYLVQIMCFPLVLGSSDGILEGNVILTVKP